MQMIVLIGSNQLRKKCEKSADCEWGTQTPLVEIFIYFRGIYE